MSSGEWTKKSGILYLSLFLLFVCAVATALMAVVDAVTKAPIDAANAKKTADGLRIVLPEFDNDPVAGKLALSSEDGRKVTLFTASKNGVVVGYALETTTASGYGGEVTGLIGYDPAGKIRKYIITGHNETPGIGTKVTDRVRVRKVSELLSGKAADASLPPNATLDSFERLALPDAKTEKWSKKEVDFVTGATISSNAVTDLAWRASKTLAAHLQSAAANGKKVDMPTNSEEK